MKQPNQQLERDTTEKQGAQGAGLFVVVVVVVGKGAGGRDPRDG